MSYRSRSIAAALAILSPIASAIAQVAATTDNPDFESTSSWTTIPTCGSLNYPINNDLPTYKGQMAFAWTTENRGCDQGDAGIGTVTYGKGIGVDNIGSSLTLQSNVPSGQAAVKTWISPGLTRGEHYTVSLMLKASSPDKSPLKVRTELRSWLFPYSAYGSTELIVPDDGKWHKVELAGYAPLLNIPQAGGTFDAVTQGGVFVNLLNAGTLSIDKLTLATDRDTELSSLGVKKREADIIPPTYFGMHVHGHDPNWPAIGKAIGTDRLWDSKGTQWGDIMANPASPAWSEFDKRVLRAAQHGADVIVVLGGNIPAYATSDPNGQATGCSAYYDKDTNRGKGSSAPPLEDLSNGGSSSWTNWVTAIANHVKDLEKTAGKKLVRNWEVWNEPDKCDLFIENPARLARLVATANNLLKNPIYTSYGANRVLSPSFTLDGFMDRYLQEASNTAAFPSSTNFPYGPAFFDVLSVHAYDTLNHGDNRDDAHSQSILDDRSKGSVSERDIKRMRRSPEAFFNDEHIILNKRAILQRFPAVTNVPLWSTEAGYLDGSLQNGPNDINGARYLARHLLLGWAAGLDLNAYYAWDQRSALNEAGTLRSYPTAGGRETVEGNGIFNVTDAGLAYQQVSKWMTGAKVVNVRKDFPTGLWELTLQRNNAQAMVVWAPDTDEDDIKHQDYITYALPYGHNTSTSLKGEVSTLTTTTIKVGANPILVSAPPTRVVIKASPSSIKVGQSVSFTATVSGGWRVPTGTVQFKANGVNLGAPVSLTAARTATLTTTQLLKSGYVSITAEYAGDTINLPNTTETPYVEIVKP